MRHSWDITHRKYKNALQLILSMPRVHQTASYLSRCIRTGVEGGTLARIAEHTREECLRASES